MNMQPTYGAAMTAPAALLAAAAMAAAAAAPARGDNVDLSTAPGRDTVQLTIYNSEDLTLVRETRRVTFGRGVNPLQFSWAGTLIDPTSVELRFRTHAGELDILDATYPHGRPQTLVWNVRSAIDGDAEVEISYFTSGITWAADYVCIAGTDEERLSFEGFVTVSNGSGEEYRDARVRLVVGRINLVEKVAELARRGLVSDRAVEGLVAGKRVRDLTAGERVAVYAELADAMMKAGPEAPKEIVKEGLSEYFIYTIEGTETVPQGWSKRMPLFEGLSVPLEVRYRYRPQEYGEALVRLFIVRNEEAGGLGTTPLPDGVVRAFRDNGRDGLSFQAAHPIRYVPVGAEIELNLGPDPLVVHERLRLRSWRDGFWFQGRRPGVYYNPQQGHSIQPEYTVAGWDDHEAWVERVRNGRDESVEVELRRTFPGHAELRSDLSPVLHDYRTAQFTTRVEARARRDLAYELILHQGINHKQEGLTLRGR
jgi:hypothetical protein